MSESPTKTSWEKFAELAMMEYVKFQMARLDYPNTDKNAANCIKQYFWQMQRDGQIYYTGVRRSIKQFYGDTDESIQKEKEHTGTSQRGDG
jgi:hypothetical protein